MPAPPLPQQLKTRDRDRIARYRRALDWYTGKQWPASRRNNRARRLTLNYAKSIIHKAASAVIKDMTNVVQPADDTDPTNAQLARADQVELALNQVREQNALDILDFDTEIDAAVLGDGCYKVFWDGARVRVTSPDPAGIFVWALPDDPLTLWRVANRYALDADATAALAPGSKTTDTNEIVEVYTLADYELWVNGALVTAEPNPYAFIPFIVFPNVREPGQQWGTSDLADLFDPLEELNRAVTQMSLITELSGNPITVMAGITDAEDIAATPGALWTLPADAKAYVLDLLANGGVGMIASHIETIYRAVHDIAETPRAAFGDTGRDLSGVALELELDPLVKKTDRKRLIRKQVYRDRNEMILALLDQYAGTTFGAVNHTIAFGSVLPTDRDREVANEIAMVAAGIHSRRYAADRLGDIPDPDAEFDRWLEEARQLPNQPNPNASPPTPNRDRA